MHLREGGLTRLIGTGLSVGTVRHRRKNECGHAKLAYGRPQHQTANNRSGWMCDQQHKAIRTGGQSVLGL